MSDLSIAPLLDTSCIVRYLTGDPLEMAARAAEIIETEEPRILSEIAVVETAYVLESFYEIPRAPLIDTLSALVQRRNLHLPNLEKPLTLEALSLCRDSKRVSFADAILWAQARQRGSVAIFSFDRRFPAEGIEVIGLG